MVTVWRQITKPRISLEIFVNETWHKLCTFKKDTVTRTVMLPWQQLSFQGSFVLEWHTPFRGIPLLVY